MSGAGRFHGEWRWDASRERLELDLAPGSGVADLSGSWTLEALGATLDGFSRARLANALSDGGEVACALTLAGGRVLHLAGGFGPEGGAQGFVLMEPAAEPEGEEPAPELHPVFQPILSLATGRVVAFEALARWPTAGQGSVGRGRLEGDGLASAMLIRSAEQLAGWRGLPGWEGLAVHVNLTGRDLQDGGLIDLVASLISGYRLPPGRLAIELTEQAALRDTAEAIDAAERLKAAGARILLDDFGSGHSSFAWLADLPADGLKLERDLVRRMDRPRGRAIVETVCLLCSRLGMTVTAEGVERRDEIVPLREAGVGFVQGFAFARPLAAADVAPYLAAQPG